MSRGGKNWDGRRAIQSHLQAALGCQVTGFTKAMWAYARQIAEDDIAGSDADGDEPVDIDETTDIIFGEYFGELGVVPLAFRLDDIGSSFDDLHVWELFPLSLHKAQVYGLIADGDGPRVTVHLLDRRGIEVSCFGQEVIERYNFFDLVKQAADDERRTGIDGGYSPAALEMETVLRCPLRNEEEKQLTARPRPVMRKSLSERAILRAVHELGLLNDGDSNV